MPTDRPWPGRSVGNSDIPFYDVTGAAPTPADDRALFSRRAFLGLGGAALLVAACGDGYGGGDDSDTTSAGAGSTARNGGTAQVGTAAATTLTAADFARLPTCKLLPEKTAGPFPLDRQVDRRDITEGVGGHPMRLGFRTVDRSCNPVPGALVEVWHANATGDYSAFADGGNGKDEAGGTTFLRGTQAANADGIVEFLTIYPGWYSGRAVHIHLRVRTGGRTVLTSQIYFDESYTESVYAQAPYAQFGSPDVLVSEDRLAGDVSEDGTIVATSAADTSKGRGTLSLLNLGIESVAT